MQLLSELEGNLKKISEFGNRYSDIKELFEFLQAKFLHK